MKGAALINYCDMLMSAFFLDWNGQLDLLNHTESLAKPIPEVWAIVGPILEYYRPKDAAGN